MGLKEMIFLGVDWIDLAEDKEVASACRWCNEPSDSIKYGVFMDCLKMC